VEYVYRPKDRGVDVKDLIRQLKEEELIGKGKNVAEAGNPYK
jgi:chromosome segregation and condensation protein ScpB